MCHSISWQQFIVTIVVFVGFYYGYVGVCYYRKDWWYRLSMKKLVSPSPLPAAMPGSASTPAAHNPLLPQVHDLVDEIRALLHSEGKIADKVELIGKVGRLLQKYPSLKDSSFQPSISQLISIESKNQCAVDLNEEEVRALWG